MSVRLATSILVVLTGSLVGCSMPDFCCPPLGRVARPPHLHSEQVTPEPIEPDTSAVIPVAAEELLAPAPVYWKLTEDECARLAVAKAIADVRTRMKAPQSSGSGGPLERRRQHAEALADQAIELASRKAAGEAASAALQALYGLAAALAQQEALRASLDEIRRLEDLIGRMQDQKLATGASREELARTRLELLSQAADAQLNVERLNLQLNRLLGLSTEARNTFWPVVEWRAEAMLLDADLLVATALEQRADLVLLRLLRHCIDCDTLPVVEAVLTGNGSTSPPCGGHLCQAVSCFLHPHCELAPACHELQVKEHELKEQVASDVCDAVLVVNGQYDQVRLAKEKLELAHARLTRLQSQGEALGGSQLEIGTAQSEVHAAQAAVVASLAAYQSAVVRLREAEGILASPYLGRRTVTRLPSP